MFQHLWNTVGQCKIWGFHGGDLKNAVFWDVAPCRSCVNRCFGGTYRLHLQGIKIRERGTSVSRWLQTLPWRWRRYVPLKCQFTQDLYGATSQKTAFFTVGQCSPSQHTSGFSHTVRSGLQSGHIVAGPHPIHCLLNMLLLWYYFTFRA
jgi:hypothetical protein